MNYYLTNVIFVYGFTSLCVLLPYTNFYYCLCYFSIFLLFYFIHMPGVGILRRIFLNVCSFLYGHIESLHFSYFNFLYQLKHILICELWSDVCNKWDWTSMCIFFFVHIHLMLWKGYFLHIFSKFIDNLFFFQVYCRSSEAVHLIFSSIPY